MSGVNINVPLLPGHHSADEILAMSFNPYDDIEITNHVINGAVPIELPVKSNRVEVYINVQTSGLSVWMQTKKIGEAPPTGSGDGLQVWGMFGLKISDKTRIFLTSHDGSPVNIALIQLGFARS